MVCLFYLVSSLEPEVLRRLLGPSCRISTDLSEIPSLQVMSVNKSPSGTITCIWATVTEPTNSVCIPSSCSELSSSLRIFQDAFPVPCPLWNRVLSAVVQILAFRESAPELGRMGPSFRRPFVVHPHSIYLDQALYGCAFWFRHL